MTDAPRHVHSHATAPLRGPLAWLYRWLFDLDHREGYAARLDYAVAVLILLSVLAIILEHVEPIYTPYAVWFDWLDRILIGLFTIEYLMRLATAPHHPEFAGSRFPRLRYLFSFYALMDLLAIAPACMPCSNPPAIQGVSMRMWTTSSSSGCCCRSCR